MYEKYNIALSRELTNSVDLLTEIRNAYLNNEDLTELMKKANGYLIPYDRLNHSLMARYKHIEPTKGASQQ